MRKLLLTGAAAGAVALLTAPAAMADEQIRAQAPNRFVNPNVEIDQGERLTFKNEDRVRHDVTSVQNGPDGKPLFATPLLAQGQEELVEGSQYLGTGSYAFVCSIHPEMKGTLAVNSAGAPVPRPGATPPPGADTTKPAISARVTRASRLTLRLRYKVGEAASLVFVAKVGSKRVGRATSKLGAAGKRTVTIKLKGVKKGARLTISIRATDAAGNVGKLTARTRAR